MGTGGTPKINHEESTRKLKAIEKLLKHGNRGSEWAETGLLHAVEKILNGHDISTEGLKKLMAEASNY